jgi:SAM-dependent methyltransferase
MGISLVPALFLARNAAHVARDGRAIILGRQKLHMRQQRLHRFLSHAADLGLALTEADVTQADGFAESLMSALGYPMVEALDFTDAEGAAHIHDLNAPLPEALAGQFDLVIDGGTSEHIFHISTALESCHRMLRPGGVFMSFVACDGWFGHGFFQTGPDVPWRFWHHSLGYEMLEVSIVPRRSPARLIPVADPTNRPRGGELALAGPHMLVYACRKPVAGPDYRPPIQGHYVRPA